MSSGTAVRPFNAVINETRGEGETVEGDAGEEIEETPEEDPEEFGQRKTQTYADPRKPSQRGEVDEHNITHLPYRSWCRHIVRGRGKQTDHRVQADADSRTVPEFHFDWCFPGEEEPGKKFTVLVVRKRDVRMTMSSVAPHKTTGEFMRNRVMAFLCECGCELTKVILKSDQEPAMVALLQDIILAIHIAGISSKLCIVFINHLLVRVHLAVAERGSDQRVFGLSRITRRYPIGPDNLVTS